jgi:23S rRNA (guanosine2251-2'-O)-methyltransferase
MEQDREDLIEGRNAVTEALRAGRPIDKLYIAKSEGDRVLGRIAALARLGIDQDRLDAFSVTGAHQGVVAQAAVRAYCAPDELLAIARERDEAPFLVACDGITDPHNLGAILRTAECAGAHGIILPKRRSAGLTAVVGKTSAGAAEHMAVARVPNLPAALRDLKTEGLWVCGAAAGGGTELWSADLRGPICLVVGSEGFGLGRLVSECCDFLISIPMLGKISSLNASAAAAVVMYEILRQRRGIG